MKQGKKLSRNLKIFLTNCGLDSSKYLVERKTSKEVGFIHKETGKVEYFTWDGRRV